MLQAKCFHHCRRRPVLKESHNLKESKKKTQGAHPMLTIPFIHHRSDDHREHATVQVKVQLKEKKEISLDNSHQACLKTTLEVALTSEE